MICSLCHKTFSNRDLNKFVIHLEYAHCMKHQYDCPICKRTFNRRDNFKTHLKTHHSTTDTNKQNLDIKNVEVISDQVHDSVVKGDVKESNCFFDVDLKTRELMVILKQSTLKLMASLHNEISIPRSFIQKVVIIFKFCISHKKVTQKQTELDNVNLRLKHTYENHATNNQFGIKESYARFIWGIYMGEYGMARIIKLLLEQNVFSLEVLNSRIHYFKYEYLERNHPPSLKREQIEKEVIIFSSSEMEIFVTNFRYYVGDLVPNHNNSWMLYLNVLEITETLSMSTISSSDIAALENLIPKESTKILILGYETNPNLYLTNDPGYKLKNKRADALNNIKSILFDNGYDIKTEDINKKIHNMRTQFFKEHLKVKKQVVSGAGTTDLYVPKAWWYDLLKFLINSDPVIKSRSNLPAQPGSSKMDSQL
ncbi:unnamed protein product [Brassicogethes aeneus]|uniref:C2H2-type domain-containing protein n=1 Tax=Brassicogethes aeneus TaxID=1431903 RepID=A0A9P0BGN5_BRAAE|nr:unnamed protein product [Brassicogethes aeneus]